MAFDRDEIKDHDGIFGIEREEWEASKEFAAIQEQSEKNISEGEKNAVNEKLDKLVEDINSFLHDFDTEGWKNSSMSSGQSHAMIEGAIKDGGIYAANLRNYLQEAAADSQYGEQAAALLERLNEISPPEQQETLSKEPPPPPAIEPPAEPEPQKPADVPVYRHPPETARESDELDLYRQSLKLNRECAAAVDKAISDSNYKPQHYDLKAAAKTAVEAYGAERVEWVLANTVQKQHYDGRYSSSNKAWAKDFDIPEKASDFHCSAHPVLLDGLISRVREKPSLLATLEANEQKSREQFGGQKPEPGRDTPKKDKKTEVDSL